jgi:hypothetical protein
MVLAPFPGLQTLVALVPALTLEGGIGDLKQCLVWRLCSRSLLRPAQLAPLHATPGTVHRWWARHH